jgi:hypothetical protein
MLYRATAEFADPTLLYHHKTYVGSQQVAGFWAYLDRCPPDLVCEAATEEDIGELYTSYHQAGSPSYADIEPVVRRAETGWIHPLSARLLDIWEDNYRLLGMFNPALGRSGPGLAAPDDIIGMLSSRNLCIDGRAVGAPVYLDATAAGLPLRPVLSADGQSNYLLYLLREIVPLLPAHDLVVLAHDTELRADYRSIAYVLTALGARVDRFEVPRVSIDGVAQSTRLGGWHGYTMGAFCEPLVADFGTAAFRLGLRLYLVAGLGRTARDSFSLRYLRRWTSRAQRLIAGHGDRTRRADEFDAARRYLAASAARRGYTDPYRLATGLLSHDSAVPVGGLLRIVLGYNDDWQNGGS